VADVHADFKWKWGGEIDSRDGCGTLF